MILLFSIPVPPAVWAHAGNQVLAFFMWQAAPAISLTKFTFLDVVGVGIDVDAVGISVNPPYAHCGFVVEVVLVKRFRYVIVGV